MTKQELDNTIKELNKQHELAVNKVKKEYILANNPYKVGDVISDNTKTIQIQSVKYSIHALCMVYEGYKVNKKGVLINKNKLETIYQSNIKNG